MPGELVPLVLLPRYTTYAGKPTTGTLYFSTVAMDVTAYSSAIVNVWRGKILGSVGTPVIAFTFQESTDGVNWTTCAGTTAPETPAENVEVQYLPEFSKRWFRLIVELGDDDNVVTCWAVGFLVERLS
jgi:hypothetical protein